MRVATCNAARISRELPKAVSGARRALYRAHSFQQFAPPTPCFGCPRNGRAVDRRTLRTLLWGAA